MCDGTWNTSATEIGQTIFGPFFNWDDDAKLREWLQQQNPDELEQFLGWFDFSTRRDREMLGQQELRKLRTRPNENEQAKQPEVLSLKPGIWGISIDLKEVVRRTMKWLRSRH